MPSKQSAKPSFAHPSGVYGRPSAVIPTDPSMLLPVGPLQLCMGTALQNPRKPLHHPRVTLTATQTVRRAAHLQAWPMCQGGSFSRPPLPTADSAGERHLLCSPLQSLTHLRPLPIRHHKLMQPMQAATTLAQALLQHQAGPCRPLLLARSPR